MCGCNCGWCVHRWAPEGGDGGGRGELQVSQLISPQTERQSYSCFFQVRVELCLSERYCVLQFSFTTSDSCLLWKCKEGFCFVGHLHFLFLFRKQESDSSSDSDSDSDSDSELIGPPVPLQHTAQGDDDDDDELVGPPLPPGYTGSTAHDEDDDEQEAQDDDDDVCWKWSNLTAFHEPHKIFPLISQHEAFNCSI